MIKLTFTNQAMAHSFSVTVGPKQLDRTIRTWKPLGYTLSGYHRKG